MSARWEPRTIAELCSRVTSGGTPSRARPDYYGGRIPWVKTGELLDREILDTEEHLTDAGLQDSSAKLLPLGTVLMAMYGATVGALGRLGREATCNQASCAMVADSRTTDSRWLYYVLLNDRPRIVSRATGAAQQNLSAATIKQFTYLAPPLREQQAIAEVLGALDDKIAANTALAKASADLAAAAFRSAVLDGAAEVRLESISELVVRGGAPRYVEEGTGVLVLNQKCIRDEVVALAPARWTDSTKVRSDRLLRFEDVLVNSTGQGTLGRVARWNSAVEATVDSHITIVRPNPLTTDATVFGHAMLAAQAEIEALGEGSTGQTELNRHELGRLRIRVPERERARALGPVLRALTALGDAARVENHTLADTRDALLPQLMSGKLRVRDAERLASEAGA